jgi:hypothetical protein
MLLPQFQPKITASSKMSNLLLKAKYSAIAALVFFIVANPELYTLTRLLTGFGESALLVLHTVVFFFTMLALMMVPRL